jgi:hypothetical protein
MTTTTETKYRVPSTREEALEALAEMDAAKWGESERAASRKLNGAKSYGLLLNSLAHRAEYDYGDSAPSALKAAAKSALTPADRAALRKGG